MGWKCTEESYWILKIELVGRRFMDVVNEDMQGLVWQRRMQGEKVRCVQMKYK